MKRFDETQYAPPLLTPDLEQALRESISESHINVVGTHSHETQALLNEIDKLRAGIHAEVEFEDRWASVHAGTDRGNRHKERRDRLLAILGVQ